MTAIEAEKEIRHCKRRIVILEKLVLRLVQAEAKREREADNTKLAKETHPNGLMMNAPSGSWQ